MRKIFLIILLLGSICSYSQPTKKNKSFSFKKGILVFEGSQEVYSMYFIESSFTELRFLLQNKDTINAVSLGGPGDDASNIGAFKHYLNQTIHFDSLKVLISQQNYQGQSYEDSTTIFTTYGCIEYIKSKGYSLSKKYKKIYYKGKIIVLYLSNYIPIESFINCKYKLKNKRQ